MRIEIRPAFDGAVVQSERSVRKAAAKALRLLQFLDLPQLWPHRGLNLEKRYGLVGEPSGEQPYSIRITQSARLDLPGVFPHVIAGSIECRKTLLDDGDRR